MTALTNRIGRLERARHADGGIVVITRHGLEDDEAIEMAEADADASGKLLIVIQRYS